MINELQTGEMTPAVRTVLESQAQKIADLAAKVEGLEHAIGAIITCLVRVGIAGRVPLVDDSEKLGLGILFGKEGIPDVAADILRRYKAEAVQAER